VVLWLKYGKDGKKNEIPKKLILDSLTDDIDGLILKFSHDGTTFFQTQSYYSFFVIIIIILF